MKRLAVAACLFVALAAVPSALADVEVSDQPYVRHDGGTDATIADCSSDATTPTAGGDGSGERQQNEPSAAVDPVRSGHMVAAANDYCSVQTTTDAWAGFYYSANGGASWTNSLLPGYPTDTSPEGQASPLYRLVTAAGDPVQAWDDERHVYFGGIAFNRARPASGSIWVARYSWPPVATAPDYEYTTLVSRGTPSPLFVGHFEDKVQLEVDKGVDSPYNGSVYLCWARFTGSASNNAVYFARSDDGARTFRVQKIAESVHGSQFCDIAVTRNGTIFVAWRQFAFKPEQGQRQDNAVAWVKSTDGGKSFSKPGIAAEFIGWDPTDLFGSPQAAGEALYQACLAGDYTPGGCSGPEPREPARSCGDGPLRCQSGYVFFRANTQVRIAADPTASGDPDAAYVVFDASVPGSLTQTGTTFGTVGSGTGSQAAVYFIKTENGGATWSPPARIDSQAVGHQFFPDIDADGGALHAVWQDSRNDCAAGPAGTAGDFRTVPIANRAAATNPPGGVNCEPGGAGSDTGGVVAVYATSANGGASWPTSIVSSALTMPQYEQFGNRDTPFFGDYNYIDAAAGDVLMAWTDERETVPGTDPRYTDGDGTDGFDVIQCRPAGNPFGADLCPNAGGLDQSIFGTVFR
jgi:hypothetical protein